MWSDWFSPTVVPEIGDYVHIVFSCIGCGKSGEHKGFVSSVDEGMFGKEISTIPHPPNDHPYLVDKWRRWQGPEQEARAREKEKELVD